MKQEVIPQTAQGQLNLQVVLVLVYAGKALERACRPAVHELQLEAPIGLEERYDGRAPPRRDFTA